MNVAVETLIYWIAIVKQITSSGKTIAYQKRVLIGTPWYCIFFLVTTTKLRINVVATKLRKKTCWSDVNDCPSSLTKMPNDPKIAAQRKRARKPRSF